jgi:hypothetical protein
MKSFEDRFCETRPGLWPRLARDVRLLWFLAGMAWRNLTMGGRVRRRYRAAMAKGDPLFVDDAMTAMMPPAKPGGAPEKAGSSR